jgi:hypothetical protein
MGRLRRRHVVVLETLLPDDAHPELRKGLRASGFEDFYRDFHATGNFKLRLSFRVGLFVATWFSPLLIGRIGPLSYYRRETRERALRKLFSSRFYLLRQTSLALKLVLSLCYGADPDVRKVVGYWQPGTGLFGDFP